MLARFPGPAVVNVYGVRVPGTEGRAGMVALTYADATRFEPRAFHEFAVARLADYAVPLFVRVSSEADLTTTFKLRKIDLQRAGYDPGRTQRCAVRARCPAGPLCPGERRGARRPRHRAVCGRLSRCTCEYSPAQQAPAQRVSRLPRAADDAGGARGGP